MLKIKLTFILLTLFSLSFHHEVMAQTTIVANGSSNFKIIIPEKSPRSIEEAAQELQLDINQATGVSLPVKRDDETITAPYISLGATQQAQRAGITTAGIPDEGFRIKTQNGSIYIIGPDTVADIGPENDSVGWRSSNVEYQLRPDLSGNQLTKNGGFSNGTANGVYTFLEDYLNVRWLLPGAIGRDVPPKSTFAIPAINRTEQPQFIYRVMPYLYPAFQKSDAVQLWTFHQKLGFSFRLNHEHYWRNTIPVSLYDTHPEWFAMINGTRPKPANNHYKIETTNSALVQYYAQKAVNFLRANPYSNTYSLSPTDSRGWSQSPQSMALYDPPPSGSTFSSVTPLILKFYTDVSAKVAQLNPQAKLAGYIYQDFAFPPQQGSMTIPQNIYPVKTGIRYGYAYYNQSVRDIETYVTNQWVTGSGNRNWFYYGLPNILSNNTGLITSPAPENLNYLFNLLRQFNFKGALLYGDFAWAQAGIGNYIQAKMLWNPELDATDLEDEWLRRAYGSAAGSIIGGLYHQMDTGSFAAYFKNNPNYNYNLSEKMFEDYYAKNYANIEQVFLHAKSQTMTERQKARLNLLEEQIIVLQWRLKNAGYLPQNYQSVLTRDNAQIVSIITAPHRDFQHFPTVIYPTQISKDRSGVTPTQVTLSTTAITSGSDLPNAKRILLYSANGEDIKLKFSNIHSKSAFLSYRITKADTGIDVQSGILFEDKIVTIPAKAKSAYYLLISANGVVSAKAKWDLFVQDAVLAQAGSKDDKVYVYGITSPVYIYVPSIYPHQVHQTSAGVGLVNPLTSEEKILRQFPVSIIYENLDKDWRFKPDPKKKGLELGYAAESYNDKNWSKISATDVWQNQGFPNFHGTAWYRKQFDAPQSTDAAQGLSQRVLLYFGAVDGDAEIFVNGVKIAEHLLGKSYAGWDEPFVVDVTDVIKTGRNLVAVQVTKNTPQLAGGIFKGVNLRLVE